jgi:hypothetical protein
MFKAKYDFIRIRQQKSQSVTDYYEKFNALKGVNETLNTNIHDDLGFSEVIAKEKNVDLDAMDATTKDDFENAAMVEGHDRMQAIHLLFGADQDVFGGLLKELRQGYLKNKQNDYPKTPQAACTPEGMEQWQVQQQQLPSACWCGLQCKWR